MSLFRGEAPLLGSNAAIDDNLGLESSLGAKLIGTWAEIVSIGPAASAVTQSVYIAPYSVEVVEVDISWDTASASGTVQVEKLAGTTASGSGIGLISSSSSGSAVAASTAGTAATVAIYSQAKGNMITPDSSKFQLAKGDRLGVVFSGTQTGLVGLIVSIKMKRI